MSKKIILTGIKPTGMPHLGNYIGAIRPALQQAKDSSVSSYLFIADYHSLTTVQNPDQLYQMIHEVCSAWLACGLDPQKTIIYRQSDIPELLELHWILSCLTPKGLMNRAHSYKALVQANQEIGRKNLDSGINMGVYNYPVLMSADILMFSADEVPVSADQAQHLEIARDLALKFNHTFKTQLLKAPDTKVTGDLLPGLDGRKMSKSYNNHIPLFCSSKDLKKLIMKIKTDSLSPEESKDPNSSLLFSIYEAFSNPQEVKAMTERYQKGVGWGEVKQLLYEKLETYLGEKRKRYEIFMKDPKQVNDILMRGAQRARQQAGSFLQKIRLAVGIRSL